MTYTIDTFWKQRLNVTAPNSSRLVEGWSVVSEGLKTFKEAPLDKSEDIPSAADPATSPLLIVSAPGAVGKTTLARQIAFETGAIYIDLAKAAPVGGNTLSGGLVRSNVYEDWKNSSVAILVDGLDEARLRVPQESYEAFLNDTVAIAANRKVPTILFGRTGAAQDSWLLLSEMGIDAPVIEIGYYDNDTSIDFAELQLRDIDPHNQHPTVQRKALQLLLGRLRSQTERDGHRFAGYAPVLRAIAERVAFGNPAALIASIEKGEQDVTLQTIVDAIQKRERQKLESLQFENPDATKILYTPNEQLDRIVARIFKLPPPPLPNLSAKDAQTYSNALDTWVADHPFLKGNMEPSSLVFDAAITTRALRSQSSSNLALERELVRGAAANPFLSEFYLPDNSSTFDVPPEHIGIIYASLRSRLSLGDSASLQIDGLEDGEEEESLKAEVEISVARRGTQSPRLIQFATEQTGPIKLGPYVDDVEINVPFTTVEIGPGPEAALIAPVTIQSSDLVINTERLIAEGGPTNRKNVYLEAQRFRGSKINAVPTIRGDASLSVSWPEAKVYPWTNFATQPASVENPRLEEALRRFRKFVIAFRSHSKGALARYQHKIEHERMTKGSGQAVLDLLKKEKIVTLDSGKSMYFLNPEMLSKVAGASYFDTVTKQFTPETIAFVRRAIE